MERGRGVHDGGRKGPPALVRRTRALGAPPPQLPRITPFGPGETERSQPGLRTHAPGGIGPRPTVMSLLRSTTCAARSPPPTFAAVLPWPSWPPLRRHKISTLEGAVMARAPRPPRRHPRSVSPKHRRPAPSSASLLLHLRRKPARPRRPQKKRAAPGARCSLLDIPRWSSLFGVTVPAAAPGPAVPRARR